MSKLRVALEAAKRQRDGMLANPSGAARRRSSDEMVSTRFAGDGKIDIANVRRVEVDWTVLEKNRILSHDTPHRAEGAYRMLRTRIMQKMRSNGWRVLGVSSIGPNEGKSFTAINLAVSIAAEVGQEALLVDLDLRRPSVHSYFGIDETQFQGLRQFFENPEQGLEEMIVSPGIDRLGCLLSAVPMERPSDVLASPRGRLFFEELRRRLPPETVVVVDLPPLLTVDDALAVAPMIDALLFVVAEGNTKRDDIAEAHQLLQEFNVIGTVLNKSVERENRKDYYY